MASPMEDNLSVRKLTERTVSVSNLQSVAVHVNRSGRGLPASAFRLL